MFFSSSSAASARIAIALQSANTYEASRCQLLSAKWCTILRYPLTGFLSSNLGNGYDLVLRLKILRRKGFVVFWDFRETGQFPSQTTT